MFKGAPIRFKVDHIYWHCLSRCVIDLWLVHIVPSLVKIVSSFEVIVCVLLCPIVLRVLVQKVEPNRKSRPTLPFKVHQLTPRGSVRIPHKDVRHIALHIVLLHLHPVMIQVVSVVHLHVRINNQSDTTLCRFNLRIHKR